MGMSHQVRLAALACAALSAQALAASMADVTRDCTEKAAAQNVPMGNERKIFMSQCIRQGTAAAGPMIGPGRPATERESAKAKDAVTNSLKDPQSAQFRNLTVHEGDAICGEVNARNSFGGYAGFQPFSYADGAVTIMPTSDAGRMYDADSKIRAACK